MTADDITRRWIRNASDELAVAAGCRFDLERAAYVPWWIGRCCRLYEGEGFAGQPLVLRGAHSQPMAAIEVDWEDGGRELSIERAYHYLEAYEAGEPVDWQYECVMRLFGWVKHSHHWRREVRRFREAFIVVAKKNKKTPTVSAIALYLECGEGEPGQKVFLAAKDGSQVRKNMSLHIIGMVQQSPELDAACKINLNEMTVAHIESRSMLIPLSSSNVRTQKSKEGLNGSIIVDEVHVVDREFMEIVSRAGISRAEPLRIEVTTAGNDPDGYGYQRAQHAREVLSGKVADESLFAAIYEAPQTLTDGDLDADPIKYGKLANPAWGHTIDPAEYLADYQRSKNSIRDLGNFKMYRLNVWQRASNPWIREEDWVRCQRSYTEESLLGKSCGAALDLGQTDDMTALSLVFPESPEEWTEAAKEVKDANAEGNELPASEKEAAVIRLDLPVRVLTWYWLPRGAVDKYGHLVPYAQWEADGHLRVTSGQTIDQNELLVDIKTIFARYDVKMFAYDPWFADPIIADLKKSVEFPKDYCWPFRQTVGKFAFPSALFERLIVAGKLHHNGNPITTWQAGHVRAAIDKSGNMRPTKPERQDRKKIDGIVSIIMGLDATTYMESVYNSCYESMGGVRTV